MQPTGSKDNYCYNCGSPDVSRVLEESPCDDIDDWWCKGCDLLVSVGPVRGCLHLADIVNDYNRRRSALGKFMEGCGY